MDKKALRQEAKDILTNMPSSTRQYIQNQLENFLYQTRLWKHASTIGITMSYGLEWDTKPIIEKAWSSQKKVCIPKPNQTDSSMKFYAIHSFQDMEEGYKSIWEPNVLKCEPISKEELNLLIVPGLLFDTNRNRLGYGGGFYDRYLQNFHGKTLALAANEQVYPIVSTDEYDVPINHLITETGLRF
ncbi:5-formyltetrahydrofolate cyclo-ligase [Radiobacillus kanasensis]|uniref:5-formyltetrahydrofolate cyclo-ligase n=1 Tax=Radiobacillus kanasensis TaxID=2844358 RepID=UPI001E49423D|nr:5-formyltetrahydrofolate cyclo-ligase [Radiobacillus kanasensis]UFT97781.1 5-formyltetrahydrofolate cyclo-ligase [Radiobacillus kanasensis]